VEHAIIACTTALSMMTMDPQVADVLAMTERMFEDPDGDKDVTFKLSDGEECAHKVILKAASEVFAGMFQQDMREKTRGVVELLDTSRVAMRVFLRLIYTGNVNPADWGQLDTTEQASSTRVLRQTHMHVAWPLLQATRDDTTAAVLLDAADGDFEFSVCRKNEVGFNIGIAPRETSPTHLSTGYMYETHGFYCYVDDEGVTTLFGQDGTDGKEIELDTVPVGGVISVRFVASTASLLLSVDGKKYIPAIFRKSIPSDVRYCPALIISENQGQLQVVNIAPARCQCPLDVLINVLALSRKYMVKGTSARILQVLKDRLADAKVMKDVSTFQEIATAAISSDLSTLRMAFLENAKDFVELRKEYDADKLRPEVAYELQAIWPAPSSFCCNRFKRFRLA